MLTEHDDLHVIPCAIGLRESEERLSDMPDPEMIRFVRCPSLRNPFVL